MEKILKHERLNGRSFAIRELIDNNYQSLPNEHRNPFKELINFILQYFEQYYTDKPLEADSQLKISFPLMHKFIYRQISNQQCSITIENNFDEQKAYDEFLVFSKNILCFHYPNKNERDLQIKKHFKIFYNDLIQFVDN